MLYCPPGINISDIWINHGLSQCFSETVTSSTIGLFLLIFGTIQLFIYKKYGTEVSPNHIVRSRLYVVQIIFTLFIPFLEVIRFILQGTVINDKTIYGYMIVNLVLTTFVYPYSLLIINKERKYLLPSVPTRGHGLVLLVFWSLAYISENLAFLNLAKKSWWFELKEYETQKG